MSIREAFNKRPGIVILVTAVVATSAIVLAYRSLNPASIKEPATGFFTVDDGKTLFVAGLDNLAPFQYDGKEAVRARVFTCDGGRTTFVAYLEKYTEDYKTKRRAYDAKRREMEQASASAKGGSGAAPSASVLANAAANAPQSPDIMLPSNTFVKKPGDTEWVLWATSKGNSLVSQKCPNGSYADFIEQYP